MCVLGVCVNMFVFAVVPVCLYEYVSVSVCGMWMYKCEYWCKCLNVCVCVLVCVCTCESMRICVYSVYCIHLSNQSQSM